MKIGADGKPENKVKEIENEPKISEISAKKRRSLADIAENFWYFHKWAFIVGVIIVIGIVISLIQLFGKETPDAYIFYIGESTLTAKDRETISEICETIVTDCNDDGEVHVSFHEIAIAVPETNDIPAVKYNSDAVMQMNTVVAAGDAVICIFEESFYESLKDLNVLEKVKNIIDIDLLPESMYDEYGVRVKNLEFFTRDGFSSIPDDSVLCILRSSNPDDVFGKSNTYWESNKKLFMSIFSYKSEVETELTDEQKALILEKEKQNSGKYDINLLYVGENRIYETTAIASAFSKYIPDSNNDGDKTSNTVIRTLSGVNDESDYEFLQNKVETEYTKLFIVNAEGYEILKNSGRLVTLTSLFENYEKNENGDIVFTYGGQVLGIKTDDLIGVKLKNIPYFKSNDVLSSLDGEMYFCLVSSTEEFPNTASETLYKSILSYVEKQKK